MSAAGSAAAAAGAQVRASRLDDGARRARPRRVVRRRVVALDAQARAPRELRAPAQRAAVVVDRDDARGRARALGRDARRGERER